jgi:murein L,D-transpeptidase YcbB/YkuD
VLTALASTPDVPAALDALEPPFRHYRLLKEALSHTPRTADEIRKIELTLERVRWLPAKLESPPIFVNIPQFKLFAFRTTDDFAQDILQMDVIVGAAFKERETPVFAADMRYIVLRPYWDVPMSIMRKEYLPLMRANPHWVETNGYEIVRGQTDAAAVMPVTPENIELLSQGKLRLRQKPGPNNALGIVKFMLPNRHNVYLHDTPTQALFKKSKRAFSHGCIRVSNPMSLLAHVLRDDSEWTQDRIDAAFESGQTLRILLKKPLRVFIIYGTALATEAGETLFFEDIYKHDTRLEAALDARSLRLAQDRP